MSDRQNIMSEKAQSLQFAYSTTRTVKSHYTSEEFNSTITDTEQRLFHTSTELPYSFDHSDITFSYDSAVGQHCAHQPHKCLGVEWHYGSMMKSYLRSACYRMQS